MRSSNTTRNSTRLSPASASPCESQAKLRIEIEALAQDRRKFNQDLIGTAARVRDVEANIDATRARLAPLDEQDKLLRKSLNDRRDVIVEILAALQRMGRQPPPALIVRPEDALQAVRTAITLGAVLPEMRAQANLLAGDLAELVRVRQQIVDESNRLSSNLHAARTRAASTDAPDRPTTEERSGRGTGAQYRAAARRGARAPGRFDQGSDRQARSRPRSRHPRGARCCARPLPTTRHSRNSQP